MEDELFLASPARSPGASETLLGPVSPAICLERTDSLCESESSCDPSNWRHSLRYYETHDGDRVMEWESFRSCSSFASSAESVGSRDSPSMGSHGPQVGTLSMQEIGDELKRKLCRERSKHLVSTRTMRMLKLWLLKRDDLLASLDRTNRTLIPGLGTWRRQRRLRLKQLDLRREADDLADAITRMPLPPAARSRSPPKKLVGQKMILSLIRNFVVDEDDVHIVGVYGTAGVGKTRIVEELHDHLGKEVESARFSVVIWLTLSESSSSIRGVQELIAERLDSSFEDEAYGNHRAAILRNTLSTMRFLLVLDGVREVLDLDEVGIPLPDRSNRCKIVITSRSKEVCESMGVASTGLLGVLPLTEEESWEMFCDIVGGVDDSDSWMGNPEMKGVARRLVRWYFRWPHVLHRIGEALRKDLTLRSWNKFVITSRAKEVCESMGIASTDLLGVLPLTEEESWEMFCDIVGGVDDGDSWMGNPEMKGVARRLVRAYFPSPHVLHSIGEALRKDRTHRSWRKIMITSHSKEMCESMGVASTDLGFLPLTEEESWEMLCDIVGGVDDSDSWMGNPEMKGVAQRLVRWYFRWPHVLRRIGEALRKDRTLRSWRNFSPFPYLSPSDFADDDLIPSGGGMFYLHEEIFSKRNMFLKKRD